MGDIGDDFRALQAIRKKKKSDNKISSTDLLIKNNICFDSKNNGAHLVVSHKNKIADFWPSTGKWIVRGNSQYQRGVFKLITEIKKESK